MWLEAGKRIAILCVERATRYNSLCPRFACIPVAEKRAALKRIAEISSQLDSLAHHLATVEAKSDIGCRVLANSTNHTLIVVVALLIACRLSHEMGSELRTVADLLSLAGNREPETSIRIRGMFRSDGILYRHVHLLPCENLDASRITITESAFNRALGLPHDKAECIFNLQAVAGRWSR